MGWFVVFTLAKACHILQEMYTVVKELLWIQTCSKILPLLPFHLPPGDRRQCGFLQNELDNGGDGVSILPGSQYQHHSPGQQANHFSTPSSETIPEEGAQSTIGLSPRLGYSDQNKNNVFSNSLASPVQRSLPPFHIAQNGYSCANNALEVEYGGRRAGFAMDLNRGGFHGGHASGSPQHAEIKGVNYIPCQMGAPVHTYGQQPLHDSINNLFSQNDSHMDTHADGSAYGLYQRG